MNEFEAQAIGLQIKTQRKRKHFTLDALAKEVELTPGYLSKVERGQNVPSLKNLQKICYALDITVNDLIKADQLPKDDTASFGDEQHSSPTDKNAVLFTKDQRFLIYNYNDVFKLESIFPSESKMKIDILTLSGNGDEYSSSKHRYDEVGIVISGKLEIRIENDVVYEVNPGEAILIHKNTEHTTRKLSEGISSSIWIKILDA